MHRGLACSPCLHIVVLYTPLACLQPVLAQVTSEEVREESVERREQRLRPRQPTLLEPTEAEAPQRQPRTW